MIDITTGVHPYAERLTDDQLRRLTDYVHPDEATDYVRAWVHSMAAELLAARAYLDIVRAHIDQRPEYVTACREAHPDNRADYWRWQGGAEARRQLAQDLGWTVPYEPGEKTGPKGADRA